MIECFSNSLILEGAQAGLSWNTILKKRENYRKAFDRFRPEKIARYSKRDMQRLLRNDGIVRNRLKIAATIENAKSFLVVREEFGTFDAYLWSFVGGNPIQNRWRTMADVPARTAESDAMSRDLSATWIQICRLDDLLRVHASNWHGQRSSRQLSAIRRAWWCASQSAKNLTATNPVQPGECRRRVPYY